MGKNFIIHKPRLLTTTVNTRECFQGEIGSLYTCTCVYTKFQWLYVVQFGYARTIKYIYDKDSDMCFKCIFFHMFDIQVDDPTIFSMCV